MDRTNHIENVRIERASDQDINLLLKMNYDLMDDEKFDRPLPEEKLIERWKEFLTDNFLTLLIKIENEVVGYSVIHDHPHPKYIRHFFIKRDFRRKGIGTKAINLILEYLNVNEMDVDVMFWNLDGLLFWKSLGFKERYIGLTYKN